MWLEIIKFLIDLVNSNQEITQQEKEQLSNFFSDINLVIDDVIRNFEKDIYPVGCCTTMSILSNNIIDLLKNKLDEQKHEYIAKLLDEASVLEKEWANRHDPEVVTTLQQISGEFKALSIMTRL